MVILCILLFSCSHEENPTAMEEDDSVAISSLLPLPVDSTDGVFEHEPAVDSPSIGMESVTPPVLYLCYFNGYEGKHPYAMIGNTMQYGHDSIPGIYQDSIFYVYSADNWLMGISPLTYDSRRYTPDIQSWKTKVDSIDIPEDEWGNIQIYFNVDEPPLLSSAGLVSTKPLPEQTWKMIRPTKYDTGYFMRHQGIEQNVFRRLDIFETSKGKFMIGQWETGQGGEFDQHRTTVYEKTEEGWKSMFRYTSQWNVPFLDIDGDGVPELFTSMGYKSPTIRQWYPVLKEFAMMESGV